MRLFAFRGTRFNPKEAGGDPGRLAAPPYDQINDEERDRFHAEDPHHFVHLSRPVATDDDEPAAHAAALHRRWLDGSTLIHDGEPGLYPYEILLAGSGRRLGVYALVGLEAPDSGVIRPHEHTITKTVAERLELLRRTRADLGPVLLLSEDEGRLDALLEEDLAEKDPVAVHTDAFGNTHRLFHLTEPARLAAYEAALAGSAGLIADGHHRYKTARLFAEEVGAPIGDGAGADTRQQGGAATKLCVITSLESSALTIDPIHRALRKAVSPDDLASGIVAREPLDAPDGAQLAAAVAAAEQPSIGVLTRNADGDPAAEIWRLDPETGPSELPRGASLLSVVLLHETLLPQWRFAPEASTDGTVLYRSDPQDLYDLITSGSAATGIWLPPMTPAGFSAAIANGDVLPPKSTRFMPKVISGLVWAEHETAFKQG